MLRKDDGFCNVGSEEIVKNPSDLYEVRKSFLKLFLDFKTSSGYFDSNVGGARNRKCSPIEGQMLCV